MLCSICYLSLRAWTLTLKTYLAIPCIFLCFFSFFCLPWEAKNTIEVSAYYRGVFFPKLEPLLQIRVIKINFNCRAKNPNLCRCIPHKYFFMVEVEKMRCGKLCCCLQLLLLLQDGIDGFFCI